MQINNELLHEIERAGLDKSSALLFCFAVEYNDLIDTAGGRRGGERRAGCDGGTWRLLVLGWNKCSSKLDRFRQFQSKVYNLGSCSLWTALVRGSPGGGLINLIPSSLKNFKNDIKLISISF